MHKTTGGLQYHTLINRPSGILGLAFLAPGAAFRLHHHKEEETYLCVEGKGELTLGDEVINLEGPRVVSIPGGKAHGYLATEPSVIFYMFRTGPYENVVYHRYDTEPNLVN